MSPGYEDKTLFPRKATSSTAARLPRIDWVFCFRPCVALKNEN
jgi:hypothetical protein